MAGSRCGMGGVGVGPFEMQADGNAVRGEAQAALQAGVRVHGGIAGPELVCKPFDSSGRVGIHLPQARQEFNGTLFHKEACMVSRTVARRKPVHGRGRLCE